MGKGLKARFEAKQKNAFYNFIKLWVIQVDFAELYLRIYTYYCTRKAINAFEICCNSPHSNLLKLPVEICQMIVDVTREWELEEHMARWKGYCEDWAQECEHGATIVEFLGCKERGDPLKVIMNPFGKRETSRALSVSSHNAGNKIVG